MRDTDREVMERMSSGIFHVLRRLLREQSVAALGTLRDDEPWVSMVPFVVAPGGKSLIIHTSHLAAHTQNMIQNRQVSVLVSEPESPDKMPQSLARVTIQGTARPAPSDDPDYPLWQQLYLGRFPAAAPLFEFGDFGLFLIDVRSARVVAGFAQALTVEADRFSAAVNEAFRGQSDSEEST